MRTGRIALGTGCLVALLVACVGGPGPLPDQGVDQASQGGGIAGDPSGDDDGQASGGSKSGGGTTKPAKPPVTLRASDYDQDCEVDSDCVAVFEGSACTTCRCSNAAIATKDANKYTSDLQNGVKDCPDPGDVACAPCVAITVGCDPGTKKCGVGVSSKDGG